MVFRRPKEIDDCGRLSSDRTIDAAAAVASCELARPAVHRAASKLYMTTLVFIPDLSPDLPREFRTIHSWRTAPWKLDSMEMSNAKRLLHRSILDGPYRGWILESGSIAKEPAASERTP